MCILWTLAVSTFINWEQLWAEYISSVHPEKACAIWKEVMENTLGYPQLHFGDEEDEEEGTHKGQVPNHHTMFEVADHKQFSSTESHLKK